MNHQKLHCYQHLIQVFTALQKIMPSWPRGTGDLRDQITRAASSGVLNLVEGNGRIRPKDRKRFFTHSIASLQEAMAALELMAIVHPPFREHSIALGDELNRISAMIRKLP
jgi:four helix bundle protein